MNFMFALSIILAGVGILILAAIGASIFGVLDVSDLSGTNEGSFDRLVLAVDDLIKNDVPDYKVVPFWL